MDKKKTIKKTVVAVDPEQWDLIVNAFKLVTIPVMDSPVFVKAVEALRGRQIIDIEIPEE